MNICHKRLIILLIFFLPAINQASSQLGLSLGTGIYDDPVITYPYKPNPLNFYIHYTWSFENNFQIRLNSGYGFAEEYYKYDYGGLGNFHEYKSRVSGMPFESEVVYISKITNESPIDFFIGIGIGYYFYTLENWWSGNGKWGEIETKGFAQYFSFGLNVNVSKSLIIFIQFRKLGLSNIKGSGTSAATSTINDVEFRTNTNKGISDIGLTVGFMFSL